MATTQDSRCYLRLWPTLEITSRRRNETCCRLSASLLPDCHVQMNECQDICTYLQLLVLTAPPTPPTKLSVSASPTHHHPSPNTNDACSSAHNTTNNPRPLETPHLNVAGPRIRQTIPPIAAPSQVTDHKMASSVMGRPDEGRMHHVAAASSRKAITEHDRFFSKSKSSLAAIERHDCDWHDGRTPVQDRFLWIKAHNVS